MQTNIHNADTEAKKAALFSKVRSGDVRILLGSTAKMGAGTNVQSRLVAVHHLDVGWKPSDMTQRNGRIIRQGNMNKEVKVFNYVTEGTFDSYLFQTLENKQRFMKNSHHDKVRPLMLTTRIILHSDNLLTSVICITSTILHIKIAPQIIDATTQTIKKVIYVPPIFCSQ